MIALVGLTFRGFLYVLL